jgi:hypothetical protein
MAAAQYVDVPGYSALLLRQSFPDLMQPTPSSRAREGVVVRPGEVERAAAALDLPLGGHGHLRLPGARRRRLPVPGGRLPVRRLRRADPAPRIPLPLPLLPPAPAEGRPAAAGAAAHAGDLQPRRPRPRVGEAPLHRRDTREPGASSCRPGWPTTPSLDAEEYRRGLALLDPLTRAQLRGRRLGRRRRRPLQARVVPPLHRRSASPVEGLGSRARRLAARPGASRSSTHDCARAS